jgi:HSP20 family protein
MLPVLRNNASLTPFFGPTNRLSTLFDSFFNDEWFAPVSAKPLSIPLSMWEDENAVHVEMDAPGLTANDIDISVHDGALTVQWERKAERQAALFEGRSYGKFAQQVALPCEVDAEKTECKLANGVLTLTMPKTPQSRPRKIEIRTS